MILSNLTHAKEHSALVEAQMEAAGLTINSLVDILCEPAYNSSGASLHYLATTLSNLSQLLSVRNKIISCKDGEISLLSRLLPFTVFPRSSVRRGGVVGTIR